MKIFISSKIHNLKVTDKSVAYNGSVSVCATLLETAGIRPYQQIDVINLSNGARWTTYALPAQKGTFTLNGGGARLGEIGDKCVLLAYALSADFDGAQVVYCDSCNTIEDAFRYEGS